MRKYVWYVKVKTLELCWFQVSCMHHYSFIIMWLNQDTYTDPFGSMSAWLIISIGVSPTFRGSILIDMLTC